MKKLLLSLVLGVLIYSVAATWSLITQGLASLTLANVALAFGAFNSVAFGLSLGVVILIFTIISRQQQSDTKSMISKPVEEKVSSNLEPSILGSDASPLSPEFVSPQNTAESAEHQHEDFPPPIPSHLLSPINKHPTHSFPANEQPLPYNITSSAGHYNQTLLDDKCFDRPALVGSQRFKMPTPTSEKNKSLRGDLHSHGREQKISFTRYPLEQPSHWSRMQSIVPGGLLDDFQYAVLANTINNIVKEYDSHYTWCRLPAKKYFVNMIYENGFVNYEVIVDSDRIEIDTVNPVSLSSNLGKLIAVETSCHLTISVSDISRPNYSCCPSKPFFHNPFAQPSHLEQLNEAINRFIQRCKPFVQNSCNDKGPHQGPN